LLVFKVQLKGKGLEQKSKAKGRLLRWFSLPLSADVRVNVSATRNHSGNRVTLALINATPTVI